MSGKTFRADRNLGVGVTPPLMGCSCGDVAGDDWAAEPLDDEAAGALMSIVWRTFSDSSPFGAPSHLDMAGTGGGAVGGHRAAMARTNEQGKAGAKSGAGRRRRHVLCVRVEP